MNETPEVIDLSQFRGSDNFYKHWLGLIYTDGVKYLAEKAGAYWLIDAIVSHQPKARRNPMLRDFQIWKLERYKKAGAKLTCWKDSGPGEEPLITQRIEYTDFPFEAVGDFCIYVENGTACLADER